MPNRKRRKQEIPTAPNGEKHPVDAVGLAVLIGKIAMDEVDDTSHDDSKDEAEQATGRKGDSTRASSMT